MSGKEILVDTNIVLYLLEGSNTLVEILQGKDIYLSFITELELIGYKENSIKKEAYIYGFIFKYLGIENKIVYRELGW